MPHRLYLHLNRARQLDSCRWGVPIVKAYTITHPRAHTLCSTGCEGERLSLASPSLLDRAVREKVLLNGNQQKVRVQDQLYSIFKVRIQDRTAVVSVVFFSNWVSTVASQRERLWVLAGRILSIWILLMVSLFFPF